MLNIIIAVFILIVFIFLIGVLVWSLLRLKGLGLLSEFMRDTWSVSLLTLFFLILFLVGPVAMLVGASWAVPLLTYTIYGWLVYIWLYNLALVRQMSIVLREKRYRTFDQVLGKSGYFNELVAKMIDLSNLLQSLEDEASGEEAHAVTDAPLDAILHDEDLFRELFPVAIRKKIRSKATGLVVQTIIFIVILVFLR